MKLLVLLLLITSLPLLAQNYASATDEQTAVAILDRMQLHQATTEDRTMLRTIALATQNKGEELEERNHDYKKSLQYIDKAVLLYEALADTLNLAFNKKYKAHLLVRLNKVSQAKAEIRSAISLYRLTRTSAGVASSQFDLARIFEFESKADSAVFYATESRSFWKLQENNLQTFLINNMLVFHLLQLNQTEKAEAIYHESELLLAKQPAHWQPVLDYYFTSMLLFKQINDAGNASHYRELYLGKIDALQKQGIAARSYYETLAQ